MIIIEVKAESGMQVFINGVPDFELIQKEIADSFIAALELQISEYYQEKHDK